MLTPFKDLSILCKDLVPNPRIRTPRKRPNARGQPQVKGGSKTTGSTETPPNQVGALSSQNRRALSETRSGKTVTSGKDRKRAQPSAKARILPAHVNPRHKNRQDDVKERTRAER